MKPKNQITKDENESVCKEKKIYLYICYILFIFFKRSVFVLLSFRTLSTSFIESKLLWQEVHIVFNPIKNVPQRKLQCKKYIICVFISMCIYIHCVHNCIQTIVVYLPSIVSQWTLTLVCFTLSHRQHL